MTEFTTSNGVDVVINAAPFQDAIDLKDAIFDEIKSAGIDLSGFDLKKVDLNKEVNGDLLSMIVKSALSVDSSKKVFKAVFKCLGRCTYNHEKITPNTFEEVEAREVYYEIVIACVKENLAPFIKGLASRLGQIF